MSGSDTYVRRTILKAIVYGIFAVIALRVGYLQLFDSKYKSLADGNVLRYEVLYAPRGEIVDRNGEHLVQSKECYDLMVTYRDIGKQGFEVLKLAVRIRSAIGLTGRFAQFFLEFCKFADQRIILFFVTAQTLFQCRNAVERSQNVAAGSLTDKLKFLLEFIVSGLQGFHLA